MVSRSICGLTNQKSDAQAWHSIFQYFNRTHGRGKAGYRAGEKIAIKANLNNTTDHGTIERLNSSPHLILSLVRQLTGQGRVPESSITVFDSSRWIPGNLYDKIHHEFPGVVFVDHIGGDGRVKAEFKPNAIPFSVETHNATGLDTTVIEAAYVIDAAVLRAHVSSGVTLCAKNLFGATSINTDWRKNAHDGFHHNSDGSASYSAFTDYLGHKDLGEKTVLFIKDVLSSILGSAVQFELLAKNPVESIRLPAQRTGRKRSKPYITPQQFDELVARIPEPYASMIFVAVYTGLRVSELAGLKWNDVHVIEQVNGNGEAEGRYSISIDERFCRGDWGAPKSDASNATIGINACVYSRIQRLKLLTVEVRAGTAIRRYKVVKSDNPEDLVFQSVKKGAPMRDNNILSRHIKPAARKMGLSFVNWRCLRTSHATWLKMAGADVKDAQAQMRHSRSSTTLDIYQQFVPESQQRAVEKLSSLSKRVQ